MLWHFAIAIWSQGALNQHRRSKDIGPFQPASIKRHQEWLANYMIFEVLEKPTTVGQRFAEAHNVKALQVSQTAMEDSEPPCSGGGTDTPFLDKQSPQTALGRECRDYETVDSPTDDYQIELVFHPPHTIRRCPVYTPRAIPYGHSHKLAAAHRAK